MNGLPDLPDGFEYEAHGFDPDVIHVVHPGHGAVSIHFKRRTQKLGWDIPGPAPRNAKLPSGRGWKTRMINQAVDMLREV